MLRKVAKPLMLSVRARSTSAATASVGTVEIDKKSDYYKTLAEQTVDTRPPDWDSARPFEEIPGPKPLPIIGNLWRFLPVIGDLHGSPILDMFVGFKKKYGNVMCLRGIPGRRDYVLLFDPVDMEHMLRNMGAFPRRIVLEAAGHYRTHVRKDIFQGIGGVLTAQGEEWFKIRTVINPILLQPRSIQKYAPKLNDIAGHLVENMKHFARLDAKNQMPDDFVNELYKWALESVGMLSFNKRFGVMDLDLPQGSEIRQLVDAILNMFEHLYQFEMSPPIWKFFSTPFHKKFVKNMDFITEFIMKNIEEGLAQPIDESLPDHELSVLQRLGKQDKRVALVTVMDMTMAGLDTTGKTVATLLYFLARNPDKQAKLREEILRVLPKKEMPISSEALNKLPYLKAVIKESNRIAPVAVGTQRTSTKDIVIGGYQVPKGTDITVVSVYTANSPDHFKDPEKFLPERWLRETKDDLSAKNANPFSSLPFGFGPRSCVGQRFATLELEVVLINIIRSLELSWEYPDMKFVSHVLYGIEGPLKLTVKELS